MKRLMTVPLRCKGAQKTYATRALTLALFLAAVLIPGVAGAQIRVPGLDAMVLPRTPVVAGVTVPVLDGQITDVINYAAGTGQGCLDTENMLEFRPAAGDICKGSNLAFRIPCNTGQAACPNDPSGKYFKNGFDLTRAVTAYDRPNKRLYLGIRVVGVIGDTDGNRLTGQGLNCSSPDLGPSDVRITDKPGIGSDEIYSWDFDTNCDNFPDLHIKVESSTQADPSDTTGDVVVSVTGASGNPIGTGKFFGSDLEVVVNDITLPIRFTMGTEVGSAPDGLSEDGSKQITCPAPSIDVTIEKLANPAAICANGTTTFTINVKNTSTEVPVTATLTDELPAGLTFDDNVTGDFTLSNAAGQSLTFADLVIPAGATRTVSFRAKAGAECLGSVRNNAKVVAVYSEPCIDKVNGNQPLHVERTAFADVTCKPGPCVTVTCSPDKAAACQGETIKLTVRGTNCDPDPNNTARITLKVGQQSFACPDPVPGNGGYCEHVFEVTMPACTGGQNVTFPSEAMIENDCASKTVVTPNPCSVRCKVPNIEVQKSAEATVNPGDTIHYVITVTNLSKETDLEKIKVTDTLCSYVKDPRNFGGDCPGGTPGIVGNVITWQEFSLPAGGSCTLTFEVTAVGDADPCTRDVTCTNEVSVTGYCGDASSTSTAHADTDIQCIGTLCRLTGGGCLNEQGGHAGHKQSTFGGNSSPLHEGGGPTGNEWEHVYRDGRTILFNWHSHDAHVIACSVVPPGPCSPQAINTRADFVGTGKYSLGSGSREEDGNMVAYIIDHKEGACNKNNRDEYSIVVRKGLEIGLGDIVFQTTGEIDCGNLQIHETPARIFGSGTTLPGSEVGQITESVALLNRAYPNPFSGSTTFAYRVDGQSAAVEVGVYNVAGRLVKSLAAGSQSQGTYTVTWNGTDDAGVRMAPGVYFLKSHVGATSIVNRVIYIAR